MTPKRRPEWKVTIYGNRLERLDVDLVAQLVIMLGRELQDAANDDNQTEEL